ncbi:MAG TPA: hypothetical protein VNF24_00510 [Candidatus Acidoferrales bacterium]|nr:hypothetical protein [Candidatus Acidoferrales bacterium]
MRHWRKMTWTLWGWTILCAAWVAAGFTSKASCSGLSASSCSSIKDVADGVAITLQVVVWLIVFLILSLIWFMTRSKGRSCPRCGSDVRKGLTVCKSCGYDFAANLGAGTPAS